MKIVTFIIPAYNVEKYIAKCLESFFCQEVSDRIEVLIINDGSKDLTSQIAHEYSDRYPDLFRVIDKENGGHGSAINYGVEYAAGKFIKVIDSDDWIETANLPTYVESLENTDADVILTHFYTLDITTGEKKEHRILDDSFGTERSMSDLMEQFYKYDECLCFHGITYRTEFYDLCKIKLSEHVFYEDNEFATLPFYKANSICPLDIFLYIYRIGDVSQSVSDKSRIQKIDHESKVADSMIAFYYSNEMSKDAKEYFKMKITRVLASYWITCFLSIPDRKTGRSLGKIKYAQVKKKEEICKAVNHKYRVLLIMSYLHVRKKGLDKIIEYAKKRRQR